MERETFAERFRRLQSAAGMTDTQVAAVMNISDAAVKKIKSGDTGSVKLIGGLRIARRFGVSPWELAFGRAGDPAESGTGDSDDRIQRLENEIEMFRLVFKQVFGNLPIDESALKKLRFKQIEHDTKTRR